MPCKGTGEPHTLLVALMAFAADGQTLDLCRHMDAQQHLDWTAPAGQWRLYALD